MVKEVLSLGDLSMHSEYNIVFFSDNSFLTKGMIEIFNELNFYSFPFHRVNIDAIYNKNVVLIIDYDVYNKSKWTAILLALRSLNIVKIIWLCDVLIGKVFPIPSFTNEYVFMNNILPVFVQDMTIALNNTARGVYKSNFNFNELSYIYRIIYFRNYSLHNIFKNKLNYRIRSDVCSKLGFSNRTFFEYFIRKNSYFFRVFWYCSLIDHRK